MQIIDMLLTPNKYSRPQTKLKEVKGVAVHYVGNAGSSAKSNRNYFEGLKDSGLTYASSHYIIGLDGEIIRCVPETEIAYCTNARNVDTISIECCHPKADGKFTSATYNSLIELTENICRRYSLNPLTDVIRHYDVTGKLCPLWYVRNPKDWEQFKTDVRNKLKEDDEVVDKTQILIDGKVYTVDRILKDGRNYVQLQSFAQAGYNISYDADKKLPGIKSPGK